MVKTISDELFEEIKQASIKIWNDDYNNAYGYVDEKLFTINQIHNIKDSYGALIGMFDVRNQEKLYNLVGNDAKELIDGWVGGLKRSIELAKQFGIY